MFRLLLMLIVLLLPNLYICNEITASPQLWLTINAKRWLELSWINARQIPGDLIIITNQAPSKFHKSRPNIDAQDDRSLLGEIDSLRTPFDWMADNGEIITTVQPQQSSQWINTGIPYNIGLSENVTMTSKCYGYWASYLDPYGTIIAAGCVRAYPTWMNDMKSVVGNFRIRDLFIPGSHDSGSYRPGFNPSQNETIVTKYALTQDENIRTQLMHGIRYLDIRVGYYRNTEQEFFINHGITRQVPLNDVLNQIKDFILETNEIIIVDIQEFPVGFGKDLTVHRKLVHFLQSKLSEYLMDPSLSWQVLLNDVWRRKKNIFLSYDKQEVVAEFRNILFGSCEQRWGNVRDWPNLERHLRRIHNVDKMRLSSRPVVDMAELTPDAWGVITDKYGGLRKMADSINSKVTELYTELGPTSNIVAVDFYRGTNIVDLAIYFNYKKVIL